MFRLEMANAGRDPRIYGDEQKRMQFLAHLLKDCSNWTAGTRPGQQRRGDWRSAEVEPAGILPLFQDEVSEVQAISPTMRRTVPAEMTPSLLLAAAEGAYSAGSQTYRGLSPTPVQTVRDRDMSRWARTESGSGKRQGRWDRPGRCPCRRLQ